MLRLGAECVKNTFGLLLFAPQFALQSFVCGDLSKLLNGLNQRFAVDWFGEIVVATRLCATLAITRHGVRGDSHNGSALTKLSLF